ncbi:hypothetical protein ACQHIV_34550 [Kribbella sp. GL6]|uniref:hypothetical protein n=1 Tax=Kribbella sp. GL6 TaxID=3419765 RepID=UPI003D03FD94
MPREGGRWPLSVVLRPDPGTALARSLDVLTQEAAALAGPDHWQTGQLGSAHLTVRALEPRREHIPTNDPTAARYRSALTRATSRHGGGDTRPSGEPAGWPATFRVTGLTLTPGTVMACAEPLDPAADTFSDRLTTELGADAWYETARRDIWYLNLLHFTGDIARPGELIDWVASRRATPYGTVAISNPELVRAELTTGHRPHMRLVECVSG